MSRHVPYPIPTVLTDRLVLRGAQPSDLEALHKIRSNEAVGTFTGGVRDRTDVWMTLLRSHGLWSMLGYGYWLAESRADGALIGEVGFADFMRQIEPDITGTPESGWIIAEHAWGKGYATEAMQGALSWLDDSAHSRSTCIINPDNTASIKVAEKLGYREFALSDFKEAPIIVYERYSPGTRKG